jgi:hypothetical protein
MHPDKIFIITNHSNGRGNDSTFENFVNDGVVRENAYVINTGCDTCETDDYLLILIKNYINNKKNSDVNDNSVFFISRDSYKWYITTVITNPIHYIIPVIDPITGNIDIKNLVYYPVKKYNLDFMNKIWYRYDSEKLYDRLNIIFNNNIGLIVNELIPIFEECENRIKNTDYNILRIDYNRSNNTLVLNGKSGNNKQIKQFISYVIEFLRNLVDQFKILNNFNFKRFRDIKSLRHLHEIVFGKYGKINLNEFAVPTYRNIINGERDENSYILKSLYNLLDTLSTNMYDLHNEEKSRKYKTKKRSFSQSNNNISTPRKKLLPKVSTPAPAPSLSNVSSASDDNNNNNNNNNNKKAHGKRVSVFSRLKLPTTKYSGHSKKSKMLKKKK